MNGGQGGYMIGWLVAVLFVALVVVGAVIVVFWYVTGIDDRNAYYHTL